MAPGDCDVCESGSQDCRLCDMEPAMQQEEDAWFNVTKPCPSCGHAMRTNLECVESAEGEQYLPGELWICSNCCFYEKVI